MVRVIANAGNAKRMEKVLMAAGAGEIALVRIGDDDMHLGTSRGNDGSFVFAEGRT